MPLCNSLSVQPPLPSIPDFVWGKGRLYTGPYLSDVKFCLHVPLYSKQKKKRYSKTALVESDDSIYIILISEQSFEKRKNSTMFKIGKITITMFISGQGVKTVLITVVDVEMWLFGLCLSPKLIPYVISIFHLIKWSGGKHFEEGIHQKLSHIAFFFILFKCH